MQVQQSSASILRPSRKQVLWLVLLVFGLLFLVYGSSLTGEFVRWDDGLLITENPAVAQMTPQTIRYIFTHFDPELYIPLTFLSYQVDYMLGGGNPFMFHLTNLLLHGFNALLIMWLLQLLFRRPLLAIFGGLLFALHPLNTEAVVWASSRKDVLSMLFFLSSLIAYISYRDSGERRTYWMSVVFFFLGLLAKVVVVTLPVILFLVDLREGRKWSRAMLREKVPYLLCALLFGIVAILGKQSVLASSSLTVKVLLAVKSTVFYLQKMLWPSHLSVLYPYLKPVTISSPDFLIPFLILAVLTLVTIGSLRWTRVVLFGFLFYILTLAPTFSNLSKAGDIYIASDRYAYLPSIGILFIVLLLLSTISHTQWWQRVRQWAFPVAYVMAGAMLLFFGVRAYAQSLVWANTESLFTNVLQWYPSYRAHNNVGNALRRRGKLDEAISHFQAANALKPDAKTYSNLGAVYRKLGEIDEARAAYDTAFRLDSRSVDAFLGLGILEAEQGNRDQALAAYGHALAIDPRDARVLINRGSLLLDLGRAEEALQDEQAAMKYDSQSSEAAYNAGLALLRLGRPEEAEKAFLRAASIQRNFLQAWLNAGVLAYQAGNKEGARNAFLEVLRINPNNTAARSALQRL